MVKSSCLLSALCAGYVSMISTSIDASLIDRGNGLIYDPDLDITWMQDAFYGGLMSQTAATAWVDNLVYGGFDDWRLPGTLNVDPSCGTDHPEMRYLTLTPCAGGEMGHLVYTEGLEYKKRDTTLTPSGWYGSLGLLNDVYTAGYWTSEDYVWTDQPYEDPAGTPATTEKPYPRTPLVGFGWLFYFGGDFGGHKTILALGNKRAAWAVRDGDVAAVPLPAAVWLFGSGLLGLAGIARCREVV